jgi:hypothetical protein
VRQDVPVPARRMTTHQTATHQTVVTTHVREPVDRVSQSPLPLRIDRPGHSRRLREEPVTASCGGCDATWSDPQATHCPRCHGTWPDVAGFDVHLAECRPGSAAAPVLGVRLR